VLARTDIFHSAMIVGDVRLLTSTTIYTRLGDIFAYASVVVTAALLVIGRRSRNN
jgi:apolipoprotein N-acyltransferase